MEPFLCDVDNILTFQITVIFELSEGGSKKEGNDL